MEFVSLHHHATNSYGDGFRTPEEHVKAVADLGYAGMALTDHGNVSGHVKLEKAAKAAGIKPLFGCELYCQIKSDERGQLKNHLTVIAQTPEGFSNLNRLVTASWENFQYKPTVTSEMLMDYSDGLIVMSGCLGGLLATSMFGGKGTPEKKYIDIPAADRVAGWFKEVFGDRYYLEVMPHPQLDQQSTYNAELIRLGKRLHIPLVATLDCHYPVAADKAMYPVLHAIERGGRHNTVEAQSQSWEYDIDLYPQIPETIYRKLIDAGMSRTAAAQAMESTVEIASRTEVEIPKFKDLRFPSDKPSDELFREWCREGWYYRGLDRLRGQRRQQYVDRAKYEIDLIIEKGFADYFLVVAEMVKWAKGNNIAVGPARGSAAASLACYMMRITEVDPMHYDSLLFERFVDPNRHDLPDIDLDFDDDRRWEVRAHLVDMYGADHVGNIGTFTQYKGKNSIDDIARVYKIPFGVTEAAKEMILDRSVGDLRGHQTAIADSIAAFPKLAKIFKDNPHLRKAMELEGNTKGFSVHAAGLVVADEPLTNGVAVYTRVDSKTGERGTVLSIDKYDAEDIGALKIDALGLKTMAVVSRCLEMVGMTLEDLYAIPLDEEEVFESFRRGDVVGIFQFDGRAMRSVCREVQPVNFTEICDINALARPGPLHSGATAQYIMVKSGKIPADKMHPTFNQVTGNTHYQVVYQEQILRIVQRMGNFNWEQAASIRRLISKKKGEAEFNKMQDLFMTGCKSNGVKEKDAAKIWKQLVTSGSYAFNSAHCVSYGMLAYWTMWLKVHHPLEFYCAALQKYDPKTKGFDLLKEATAKGIAVLPPDPNRSQATWSVDNGALRAGMVQVSGIGEKMAQQMLEWREDTLRINPRTRHEEGLQWADYADVRGIGPKTMEKVAEFCADPDPFGVHLMSEKLTKVRKWLRYHADENFMYAPTSKAEDVSYEPASEQHTLLLVVRERNHKDLQEQVRSRTGKEVDLATTRDPQYLHWATMIGEDETGPLAITVHRYRGLYEKYADAIWGMDLKKHLLLVRGYKGREYRRAIYAEELWVIDPDELGV